MIEQIMEPTFMGAKPNQGRIIVGKAYPEGYAVIRCGNTEVQISYTLLHDLQISIEPESAFWNEFCQLRDALNSIACEASMGRTGDD